MRALFTTRANGWRQKLMAVPRSLTSNVVNALAAIAAIRRYRTLRASNAPPIWGKTLHRFPVNPS